MTDDRLKKAEAQREQHRRDSDRVDAEQEAAGQAFFDDHRDLVVAVLSELGELWKSMNLNRIVLFDVVTTHVGDDFRVHVAPYQSPVGVELFLFDKDSVDQMYEQFRDSGLYLVSASVRVLIKDGHFEVYVLNSPGFGHFRLAQTIDDLKAVLADFWAAGQVIVSH